MKYLLIILAVISLDANAYNKGSIYAEGGKMFNESDAYHFGVGASYADKWQLGFTMSTEGDTDFGRHDRVKIITIDSLYTPNWLCNT